VNWGDLPFKISVSESVGYNDNILGAFQGQPLPNGIPARGDLFSTTLIGVSTKFNLGPQQFFADGSYGFTKYRIDAIEDTNQYSFDSGVNWNLTSRCSGRLVGAANEYQSPIIEQVGPGINTVNTLSFNETAKCLISGYVSAIGDSGVSSVKNSQALDALNNYNSVYVRGGLEYALTGLDTFRALTTFTQRQFTNRSSEVVPNVSELASGVDQIDYQLYYNRILTGRLTFNGMVGASQFSSNLTDNQTIPIYSASLSWQATPKLSFGLASSRTAGAPTSVVANAQTSEAQSFTASYSFSPKISLTAGIAVSQSESAGLVSFGNGQQVIVATQAQTGTSAFGRGNYQIDPFLSATASYSYSDRRELGSQVRQNIFMIGLSYRPQ
jgi:hypothetical protein